MSANLELDTWRRQWQAEPERPSGADQMAALRVQVLRRSQRRRIELIAPLLVTVFVGGGVVRRALVTSDPVDFAFAAESWIFILATWGGMLWIARGTWQPLAQTTAAFVDISIRTRQARLKAMPFGMGLYVCQQLVVLLVKLRYSSADPVNILVAWPVVLFLWIGTPALLVGGSLYLRKQRAELAHLLELEKQLNEDIGRSAAGERA